MCVGTGTAVAMAVGMGATATGSIVSAKMGADAAHEGATANISAADKAAQTAKDALAENKRQFDLTQQNNWAQYLAHQQRMAPYQGLGLSATSTLSDMMHVPIANVAPPPTPDWGTGATTAMRATPAAPPPDVPQAQTAGAPPAQTAGAPPPFMDRSATTATAMPTLNSMLVAPLASMASGVATSAQQALPMASAAPQMVMMRAPNGMTQKVPANQVAHYQSKGATLVSA